MNRGWHFNKKTIILVHIIAWVVFFSLPLLLHPPFNSHKFPETNLRPPRFDLYHTISDLLLVGIFYLNVYVLLPDFIRKRRIGRFILIQLLIFLGFALLNSLLFRWVMGANPMMFRYMADSPSGNYVRSRHPAPAIFLIRDIFPYFLIFVSSTAYRMVIDRIKSDRLTKEKENENLKTELLLLRSQISPHFMFNVLNNMVSLARKHSDQLEPSLIKLSSLMRYMYFEAREDKVPLSKETDYLQSYIDLQKQRFQGSVTVKVNLHPIVEDYMIEPMLMIPFVENAFKHGTGLIEDAEIDISLQILNDVLCFFVSNKFSHDSKETKDRTPGIGLANVKRRLNLLYGDRHQLNIITQANWHTVSLQLNLN